jgi:hypothetical protein
MNTQNAGTHNPMTDRHYPDGATMLMQEDLARARMRESQRVAAEWRLARRLVSARRWNRLARWASRHAAKAKARCDWESGEIGRRGSQTRLPVS